jgi:SAM-dependent methyltransferase
MRADGRPLWNHNIAYHQAVLDAAPTPCHRALDVGCGQGFLLPELADRCSEVVGIDPDETALAGAAHRVADRTNVTLVRGDVMTADLQEAGFDLVAAVASIHHLPLEPALGRLATLVRPGGSLAIVGPAQRIPKEQPALDAGTGPRRP